METQQEVTVKDILNKLNDWWTILKVKKIKIMIFFTIGIITGFLWAYFTPIKYKGVVTLIVQEKGSGGGLGAYSGLASQFGIDVGGGGGSGLFTGDNVIEFMKSRTIIQKTLLNNFEKKDDKTLLIDVFLEYSKIKEKNKKNAPLNGFSFIKNQKEFSRFQDSILDLAYDYIRLKNLNIGKNDKKLDIINLGFVCENEAFSKCFLDLMAKNVSAYYTETQTKKSRNNVELLQNRADSIKAQMDAALYGRATFNDQNLFLVNQKAGLTRIKKERDIQVLTAMYTEIVKNLEIAKFTLLNDEPLIQVIDNTEYPLEKVKKSKSKTAVLTALLFGFLISAFYIIKFTFTQSLKA